MNREKGQKNAPPGAEGRAAPVAGALAASPALAKGGLAIKLALAIVWAMIVWGGGAFATMWLPGGPMAVATAVASDGFPLAVAELGEAGEPIVAQATGETLTLADGGDQGAAGAASAGTLNIPLEPFVVGVSDGPGRAFLMARIGLEVGDQAAADELAKSLQKVRDRIVIVLSSQDKGSLMAQDGKERLRGLILREANTSMGTHKINKVVFHQLIIQ